MRNAIPMESINEMIQNTRSMLESVCIVRDKPWMVNDDEYSLSLSSIHSFSIYLLKQNRKIDIEFN